MQLVLSYTKNLGKSLLGSSEWLLVVRLVVKGMLSFDIWLFLPRKSAEWNALGSFHTCAHPKKKHWLKRLFC